jgi:hypothetical protein
MLGGAYDVLESIGVTVKAGGGSAGSLSSYPFSFLLSKAVAHFLLQCVEQLELIIRRRAAREQGNKGNQYHPRRCVGRRVAAWQTARQKQGRSDAIRSSAEAKSEGVEGGASRSHGLGLPVPEYL